MAIGRSFVFLAPVGSMTSITHDDQKKKTTIDNIVNIIHLRKIVIVFLM